MRAGNSAVLVQKPWRTNADVCQAPPWGLLGKGEGHLLYYLARDYYRGDGVIVDAGSFLGRSAWFFATGLDENLAIGPCETPRIHCFDNFIINDPLTPEEKKEFGQDLPLGASTRRLFDAATHSVSQWLDVHEGDFHTYPWEPRPIEILLVDIAKTASLNSRLVDLMFPCLIPGRSIVVQQDYHHPWLPYIHVTMEYLQDYFEIVEPRIDGSAAFRLTRAIPDSTLRIAARVHELPPATQLALMDQAIRRLPERSRHYVALARANLIGQVQGYDSMRAAMDDIDARYATAGAEFLWDVYRGQMRRVLESLRNDLSKAWQLVQAGDVDEAMRMSEAFQPGSSRYGDALILRAHCLRRLKRHEEAEAVLHTAFALRPADSAVWVERAWLEFDVGDHAAAQASARHGLAVANESAEHRARCLDVLAQALSASGKHDEAIAAAAEAVAGLPGTSWILAHHAQSLLGAGRFEEAAAVARELLTLTPSDEAAMYILERAQYGVTGSGKRF